MRLRCALAAAAVVVGALSGCFQGAEERTQAESGFSRPVPPVPSPYRPEKSVTITYYGDPIGMGKVIDTALAERFTADTGVKVTIVPRPPSVSDAYALYQRMFETPRAELDVVTLDVIWPGALAEHLADLTPALGEQARAFFPEVIRNNTVGGKLVAMPWFADAGLLFYRTDLLARHGYAHPPATWDELEAMARKVQAAEREADPAFSGFVWQGRAYEGLTCNALEWQVSHGGGEIFHSETGAVNLKAPQTRKAFERAAAWVGTISPPEVTDFQEEDARQVFQAGRALFMRNWPYAIAAGNAEGSPIRGKFDVAPLPRDANASRAASTLGGWQLGVSRTSRHPEAAVAFVRYLTSPQVQAWRAFEGTYLPTIRELYTRQDLLEAHPFFAIMPHVLDNAVARPSSRTKALYPEVSTLYYQGVSAILGGAPAERTLSRMQAEISELAR